MRDVMFDIPSNPKIVKCVITKDTVESGKEPKLTIDENRKKEPLKMRKTNKKNTTNKTA